MHKRILVLTYYWPPSGGAGVQRWLKWVKYIRLAGWEPVVYTVDQGEWPTEDRSLLNDIPADLECIKHKITEPYAIYKWFTGRKPTDRINPAFFSEQSKQTWRERLSIWIRANFFIPDARCWWINPSIRVLKKYLQTKPVAYVISSGPPHSMHRIGRGLKRFNSNLIWIADFRDPWTDIDYMHHMKVMFWAKALHRRMEREVLLEADGIICIGKGMSNRLQNKIAPAYGHKFKVIYNGYDADDSSKSTVLKPNNTLVLSHLGTLVKDRNPEVLWETIADLKRQDTQLSSKLKIQCIGKTDAFIKERIRVHGIEDVVQFESYKPHNEILALQQQSDVLILIINNTPHAQDTITGKVFEYMHAQKPILCIGPLDGEAAALLTDTQTGITVGYSDHQQLKTVIQHWLKKRPATTHTDISRFSRKVQVDDLLAWLKQMPLGAKQFH